MVKFCTYLFGHTINGIAVPLFFILSGATFYRDYTDKKYVKKLLSRVNSLVTPFVLWNIVNMILILLHPFFSLNISLVAKKMVLSLPNILLGIFHYKYNGPFWFIFALIIFTVVAPIIDKLLYSKITSLLSITILIILACFNIGLPQPLFFTKTCIIFYLIGGYIGRFYFDEVTKPCTKKRQLLSAGMIVAGIIYYMLLNYKIINQYEIVSIILLIFLSICFWNAMDLFLQNEIPAPNFARHSFWIFALHINVGAVVTKILFLVLPKTPFMSILNFALTTIITLVGIEIICYIVNKISHPIYSLLSGAR